MKNYIMRKIFLLSICGIFVASEIKNADKSNYILDPKGKSTCRSNLYFKANSFKKLNILSGLMYPCYKTKIMVDRLGCGVPKDWINTADFNFQVINPEENFWDDLDISIAALPETINGQKVPFPLPIYQARPCTYGDLYSKDTTENQISKLDCPIKNRTSDHIYTVKMSLPLYGTLAGLVPKGEKVKLLMEIFGLTMNQPGGKVIHREYLGVIEDMSVEILDKDAKQVRNDNKQLPNDPNCYDRKFLNKTEMKNMIEKEKNREKNLLENLPKLTDISVRSKKEDRFGTLYNMNIRIVDKSSKRVRFKDLPFLDGMGGV